MVVVSHGDIRTTLEPVTGSVPVGRGVAAGDVVGVLEAGHACGTGSSCLHWGLRRGEEYLDPLATVGLGITGSLVGGLVARSFGAGRVLESDVIGLVLAVVGAALFIGVAGAVAVRNKSIG